MVDIKLETYNKVCPIPAAMTKKAAIKMEKGQTIQIEGDFCPAIENVIRMLEKHGLEITEKEIAPDYFRVCALKM
ncbi:sulfurtransferase TusA family protein [Promethearchaeum syntrophicum]|uniref:Sulfurtransferase TusA family protein n=1 Tax=Promethearchaeum syntrophicum TaxID=2594042 RepID=A0A5B9D6E9_9ARCH|nr:sulfurtransferase TusA family protein [Candidatus Prometheoarchaeum syntrophicum]QEE14556.1 SirA-like protein [Candidatus Prometheoarchaeum syntrophicum]